MKNFEYEVFIAADKAEVFSALTNSFQIELWSGYPAVMDACPGTEFSLWEGDICGVNLEVNPPSLLVQEWFLGSETFSSIVRLHLEAQGGGTKLVLRHTDIPDEVYDEITEGWKTFYIGAIKDFLEAC